MPPCVEVPPPHPILMKTATAQTIFLVQILPTYAYVFYN